jgi:hypothetical protein
MFNSLTKVLATLTGVLIVLKLSYNTVQYLSLILIIQRLC